MVIDTISFEVYQKIFPKRLPNLCTKMFDLRKFYFSLLMEFTLRSMTRTLSLGQVKAIKALIEMMDFKFVEEEDPEAQQKVFLSLIDTIGP